MGAGWEVGRVFLLEKTTRFAQTSFFLPEKHAPPPAGRTLLERKAQFVIERCVLDGLSSNYSVHRTQSRDLFQDYLDYGHQGDGQQYAYRAPEPAPEEDGYEDDDGVDGHAESVDPGFQEEADDGGEQDEAQRCQRHHPYGIER